MTLFDSDDVEHHSHSLFIKISLAPTAILYLSAVCDILVIDSKQDGAKNTEYALIVDFVRYSCTTFPYFENLPDARHSQRTLNGKITSLLLQKLLLYHLLHSVCYYLYKINIYRLMTSISATI